MPKSPETSVGSSYMGKNGSPMSAYVCALTGGFGAAMPVTRRKWTVEDLDVEHFGFGGIPAFGAVGLFKTPRSIFNDGLPDVTTGSDAHLFGLRILRRIEDSRISSSQSENQMQS